jgi:hypothetical protein
MSNGGVFALLVFMVASEELRDLVDFTVTKLHADNFLSDFYDLFCGLC